MQAPQSTRVSLDNNMLTISSEETKVQILFHSKSHVVLFNRRTARRIRCRFVDCLFARVASLNAFSLNMQSQGVRTYSKQYSSFTRSVRLPRDVQEKDIRAERDETGTLRVRSCLGSSFRVVPLLSTACAALNLMLYDPKSCSAFRSFCRSSRVQAVVRLVSLSSNC